MSHREPSPQGTSARTAVVIGAGSLGCVIAQQLLDSGLEVSLVTHTPESTELLAGGGVRLRCAGAPAESASPLGPAEIVPITRMCRVLRRLQEAAVVVVAVPSTDHAEIAPLLARGLESRTAPVDVLVCDNRETGASALRALVAEHGDDRVLRHGYAGALLDRTITRRTQPDGSVVLVSEAASSMFVDARALGCPLPAVDGIELVEDFSAHVMRKLFVFGAGQAAAAYLGRLYGYRYLSDALADTEIALVVRAAMTEGQRCLAAYYDEWFAGGEAEIEAALRRIGDPDLADTVNRAGRDQARKLGSRDRICGPARVAPAAGVATPALAMVAAAALRPVRQDQAFCELLLRHGTEGTLVRLGHLTRLHPFVDQAIWADRLLDTCDSLGIVLGELSGEAVAPPTGLPRAEEG